MHLRRVAEFYGPVLRAFGLRIPGLRAYELRVPELRVPELRVPELRLPELRAPAVRLPVLAVVVLLAGLGGPALAQALDMSHGGPIEITARDDIEWHQTDQQVIAIGDARAVRGNVTVIADRLIAHYRRKAGAAPPAAAQPGGAPASASQAGTSQAGTSQAGTSQAGKSQAGTSQAGASQVGAEQPGSDLDTGNNEIYRLEAVGQVHIYTATDQAWADHAVYDIDQSVLVMTGHALKITTPQDVITARDSLEYWSQRHMAVARGDAVVVTSDARRISADTLVAYTTPPPTQEPGQRGPGQRGPGQPGPVEAAAPIRQASAQPEATAASAAADPLTASGRLQRVEAFGHVVIRTPTQTVQGDRGVYVPDTGIARMAGGARLTQGDNQVNGAGLEVNLRTGIYRLISAPNERVEGLVVPNDTGGGAPAPGPQAAPGAKTAPAPGPAP
jgi:lipopolysaccharide export system protein LptA